MLNQFSRTQLLYGEASMQKLAACRVAVIENAKKTGVPVISPMGAGNKVDPKAFEAADIYETSICPLAGVMRREYRKNAQNEETFPDRRRSSRQWQVLSLQEKW